MVLQADDSVHLPTEAWAGKSRLLRSQRTPGTGLEMSHLYLAKNLATFCLWSEPLTDAEFRHNELI